MPNFVPLFEDFDMLKHGLEAYDIPFVGLKLEKHVFSYEVDSVFFDQFENSLITDGDIFIHLTFDKQKDHFFVLEFYIDGTVETECDRCLDPVNVQINSQNRLIVKFAGDETAADLEDPDVWVLDSSEVKVNIAKPVFDYIHLAMPLKKTCRMNALGSKECNPAVLKHLKEHKDSPATEDIDPRWEALKKLK